MASDVQKYRATTFQIAGFALMTPFGNLIVNFLDYHNEILNLKYGWYNVINQRARYYRRN